MTEKSPKQDKKDASVEGNASGSSSVGGEAEDEAKTIATDTEFDSELEAKTETETETDKEKALYEIPEMEKSLSDSQLSALKWALNPDAAGDDVDLSLGEVLDLLWFQTEKLKTALELQRRSEHPDKQAAIRWYVEQIDIRHERMDQIKAMMLARDRSPVH